MVIHDLDDLGYPYDLGNLHWSNDHSHWKPHLIAVKTIRFPAVKYGRVTVARTTTKRPMMCSTRSCFWSNTSSEVTNIHSDSPAINLPFCGGWWSRKIHRVSFRDSATHPGLKPRKSSNQDDLEHKNHCNASRGLREYNVVTTYTSMISPSNDVTSYHPSATSQHAPNTTPPWPWQYAAVGPTSVPHLSQYLQGCCIMQHLTGLEHHLPHEGIHHGKAQSEHAQSSPSAALRNKTTRSKASWPKPSLSTGPGRMAFFTPRKTSSQATRPVSWAWQTLRSSTLQLLWCWDSVTTTNQGGHRAISIATSITTQPDRSQS